MRLEEEWMGREALLALGRVRVRELAEVRGYDVEGRSGALVALVDRFLAAQLDAAARPEAAAMRQSLADWKRTPRRVA